LNRNLSGFKTNLTGHFVFAIQFTMMKTFYAALWGAFTSLGVAALCFMANDLAKAPDLPRTFTSRVAVALGFSTPVPLWWSFTCFALLGAILGAVSWGLAARLGIRWELVGAAAGLALLVILLGLEIFTGRWEAGPGSLAFLAIAFAGWGAVLGRLLRDTLQNAGQSREGETPVQVMRRRQFLYLVIAGVLTLALSALRIDYYR
jgi:hypothetical protein